MTLPAEVSQEATNRLPQVSAATPGPVDPPHAPSGGVRTRAKRAAKVVLKPVYQRVLAPVARSVDTLARRLDDVQRRLDRLEARDAGSAPSRVDTALLLEHVRTNTINQTLLKAEFGDVLTRMDDLGMAIAPASGIEGAAPRLAEQREHLASLDRRLRLLDERVSRLQAPATGDVAVAAAPAPKRSEDVPGFDYVGFERRFRGDPAEVLRIQRERYVPLLAGQGPVVDIGCGRGELLSALAEVGTEGIGVEPEPGMAAEARARGMRVEETDATTFLRSCEPGSLGAIFSAHVVEHVELDYLLEFIHLAYSRLRPGGLFVAETPNPASLVVLGNSYILDPTHVRPLHPSLMAFLCENAGFRDVRLNFYSPAEAYHLPTVDPALGEVATAVDTGFRRLNDVLFGAQEYTVVARVGEDPDD
ncbi:class I SAM-dependent methyltransferase [Cellulomonas shaoxiangyii]|uniref:Class I SAM-dependent methyltransferase n=1 Tax=Cellulomonas shaoxiangyii TaxID=2566013 RepID=A0A4P7SG28_9CELL|nr:class I SAM-dependent methyltransferase [Cellulomonas shaoxiangyii]QCB93139.1 class I SAM-dependent methyltransferase [Cellulomonas shaoxiangyii]TGY84798.1 class I SAM-dependent methyltransferase [Cellulomonas shaoxiangyii]